jgi:YihY family inner membrane protein
MSTATTVPERRELDSKDPKEMVKYVGWGNTFKDAFTRFRGADGTSHIRAFAHAMVLAGIPALITIIGLATVFDLQTFRNVLESTLRGLAPGPSSRLLTQAFQQGSNVGTTALVGGIIGAVVSGTFAMMTLERGFNRIYGMQLDRSFWRKVAVGLGLALSAGILLGIAFLLIAAGGALGDALKSEFAWSDALVTVFSIARWVVGLLLAFVALTLLYRVSPNRKQPAWKWLQTGTITATMMWFAMTGLLGLYYSLTDRMSQTYGPLLGLIALLTWAYATALSLNLGMALAAQLEAVRSGKPGPRTHRRYNETVPQPERDAPAEHVPPPPVDGRDRGRARSGQLRRYARQGD